MRTFPVFLAAIAALALSMTAAGAQIGRAGDQGWQIYVDKNSGTRVDFPSGLFPVDAGAPERGAGRIFQSRDGRARFSAYALDKGGRETPQSYLERYLKVDPSTIDYKRVTSRFFVVSGIRNNEVYYSRCNFYEKMHCIYLSYPARELRAWDGVVKRVSHSLRGSSL